MKLWKFIDQGLSFIGGGKDYRRNKLKELDILIYDDINRPNSTLTSGPEKAWKISHINSSF
jgi:hypothetical protein